MRTIISFLLVFLAFGSVSAQKGTTTYLDEKNGFKTLILGSPISNYSDIIKPTGNNDGEYEITDSTFYRIGDVRLTSVVVSTFDGKIRTIGGVAKKEFGRELFNTFLSAYGTSYVQLNRFIEKYNWLGDKVSLYFNKDDSKWCVFILKDLELDRLKAASDKEKTNSAVNDL